MADHQAEKKNLKEEVKEIKDTIVVNLKEAKDEFKEAEKLFEKHPSSLE